jgi:hypothetical protein
VTTSDFSLSWILPFVRKSIRGHSTCSYDNFIWRLWEVLERAGVPGIVKTPPEKAHTLQPYVYTEAHHQLRFAAADAFSYMLQNGFIIPEPPNAPPLNLNQHMYAVTPRGSIWAADVEPLPEDASSYMAMFKNLVPNLDGVIEQYVAEALTTFDRRAYFATAVMVGAAAEKAIYLLAEAMLGAFADPTRKEKLERLMERRKLNALLQALEKAIHDVYVAKVLPFTVFDGVASHLVSLFEAIRIQRNDAVHPMNAAVSPDGVRLSLCALPYATKKIFDLRDWFMANPKSI